MSDFAYELAHAGNMMLTPAIETEDDDPVTIVTSRDRQTAIRSRFPKAIMIDSPTELHILLEKGVAAWKTYRDQVMKQR